MNNIELAIDIGSGSIRIFEKDEGLILKEPTFVLLTNGEEKTKVLALGQEAQKLRGKTEENVIFFYPISLSGEIKNKEYLCLLLRHCIDKVVSNRNVGKIHTLLPLPMGLSAEKREEYVEICKLCGIASVDIIPKIICSAYGMGFNPLVSSGLMAVDIGAGNVEVATISMGKVIKGATTAIGGRAVDASICSYMEEMLGFKTSLLSATKVKEEIGSLLDNDRASIEIVGTNIESGSPLSQLFFSGDVNGAIYPYYEEINNIILTTLNECPPEIAAEILKNGVKVTGGGSSITGLATFIKDGTGLNVEIYNDIDAVITGAGRLLSMKYELNQILSN